MRLTMHQCRSVSQTETQGRRPLGEDYPSCPRCIKSARLYIPVQMQECHEWSLCFKGHLYLDAGLHPTRNQLPTERAVRPGQMSRVDWNVLQPQIWCFWTVAATAPCYREACTAPSLRTTISTRSYTCATLRLALAKSCSLCGFGQC